MADGEGTKEGEGGNGGGGEVTRPEWLPETLWDADAKAPKADDIKTAFGEVETLRAFKTEQETKLAGLPKDAAGYKIELPKDFPLPNGADGKPLAFQVDEKDARIPALRDIAVKHKLPQDAVSDMVAIQANYDLAQKTAEQKDADDFFAAEKQQMGAEADKRIAAAKTWLEGKVGKDAAGAFAYALQTSAGISALEKLAADPTIGKGHSDLKDKPKGIDTTGMTAMQIFNAAGAAK